MKSISFIIPVYNNEKYLSECVNSIININLKNAECILIDDGSTDNSSHICDVFSQKYEFISVCHVKNTGVSNARNIGINIAKGEFITFVDSDDFINNIDFTFLNDDNDNYDLYCVNYSRLKNNTIKKNKFKNKGSVKNFITQPVYMNSVWNKFYRTRIIKENNIRFDVDLFASEDLLFNLKYIDKCTSICYIDENYYVYRLNEMSLTQNKNRYNTIINNINARKRCIEVCKKSLKDINNDKLMEYFLLESILPYLIDIDYYNPINYRKCSANCKWVFNWRVDYLILTCCANWKIDFFVKVYIKLKKILKGIILKIRYRK